MQRPAKSAALQVVVHSPFFLDGVPCNALRASLRKEIDVVYDLSDDSAECRRLEVTNTCGRKEDVLLLA